MVKIEFPLPFKLPIKDNSCIVSAFKLADIKAKFSQRKIKFKLIDNDQENEEEFTSILVEYYENKNDKHGEEVDNILHNAVVNSIYYLNRFIDALRSKLNIREISNFTITDLPSTIMIEYKNEGYVYVTNPVADITEYIEVEKDDIVRTLGLIKKWDDYPFIEVVDKFYAKAKHHLAREDFIFAIVELQTSFEVFIRNTHKLILIKDNATEEKIEQACDIPFRNVIEQHLAKALKVDLKFKEPGVIKNWYDNLYTVRNQIVHSGKSFIDGITAYNAYDSYVEARDYISDLLVKEGYLLENGMAELDLFIKNSRDSEEEEERVRQRLIEKGIISSDIPFVKMKLE